MPINSHIRFEKLVAEQVEIRTFPFQSVTIGEVQRELNAGAYAVIVNTFEGKVPLHEMIESTSASVRIMESVNQPVDIIAVMERGSSLNMSISDIKKTSEIMDFAGHPGRGATIAVMKEKSVTKFFLTLANQLLPNANFVVANSMDEAEVMLEKARRVRA